MRQSIARLASVTALVTFGSMLPALANDTWYKHCKHTCKTCEGKDNCTPGTSTYTIKATAETDSTNPNGGDACTVDHQKSLTTDVQGSTPARGVTPLIYRRESSIFEGVSPDYVKYETVGGVRKPLQLPLKDTVGIFSDSADGKGHQIAYYIKSQLSSPNGAGLYTVPAGVQPSAVTIYRNPDGDANSTSGRLDVVHKQRHPQSGAWLTTTIRLTAPQNNNQWKRELFSGDPLLDATLIPYRSIEVLRTTHADGTETVRETTKDQTSGNTLVTTKDQTLKYGFYKYGSPAVLEQTDHTGTGSELTSNWTYYTNRSDQSSFNKPATMLRNDGQWANYSYSGSLVTGVLVTKTVSGWLDNPHPAAGQPADEIANRVVTEIEASGETGTFGREEKVQGVLVSKSWGERYKDNAGQVIEKSRVETGTATLLTIRTGYPTDSSTGEAERGRLKSIEFPDGTVELHRYQLQGTNLVETVDKGAGNLSGVTDGTRTVSTYTNGETLVKEVMSDIASGVELSAKEAIAFDGNLRPTRWAYNHNPEDFSETIYGCCGIDSERSRDGIVTTYKRDALKRTLSSASLGVTVTHSYGKKAIGGETFPTVSSVKSAGILVQSLGTTVHDHAGNQIQKISPDLDGDGQDEVATTTRNVVSRAITITGPDGSTIVSVNFADGQGKSIIGTASSPSYSAYGAHSQQGGGIVSAAAPTANGPWTRNYRNLAGHSLKTTFDDGTEIATQTNTYDALGRAVKATDADGITRLIAYNAKGEAYRDTIDLNQNGQIDPADRITDTITDVLLVPGFGPALRSRSIVYGDANNAITVGIRLRSPDGTKSSLQSLGVANTSISQNAAAIDRVDGEWSDTIIAPDGTKQVTQYGNWLPVSTSSLNTENLPLETSSTAYDVLRRPVTKTNSRTGAVTKTYAANGQVASIDDHGRIMSFSYDKMGQPVATTLPDNSVKYTSYWPTGQVKAEWGSQTFPTVKFYSDKGQLIKLRTFRRANLSIAPDEMTADFDETNWLYNSRGQLQQKQYADGNGPSYTYTPAGRLHTRTWARTVNGAPLVTTYGYNAAGENVSTDYSDNTPDVVVTLDKQGRQTSVSNGIAKSDYAYDPATQRLDKETISYNLDAQPGFEFVRVLDRSQDAMGRDTGWQLKNGTTVENEVAYGYNAESGRLASVTAPSGTFSYLYIPESSLIASVTGPAHTVTNTWFADRDALQKKDNKAGETLISSFDYGVNAVGQRTGVATSGAAFANSLSWAWEYDSLGQVTKADNSTNNAFDRSYQFDAIGNRKKSADNLTLPADDNYTVNALNQYSSINQSYDSEGNITSGPVHPDGSTSAQYCAFLWDAENRLISTTVNGTTTNYLYDFQSRCIAKRNGTNGTVYLYDDWNCIAEYLTIDFQDYDYRQSYTWGLDLSGTTQGAGGVGGLLSVTDHGSITVHFFPSYDGNGNVSEYLNSNGSMAAHFEYDPFGNAMLDTDANEKFAYRFSTKPRSSVTSLYYYGYRWYDAKCGGWLSRDPMNENWETGEYNLNVFVLNDPIRGSDILGLQLRTDDALPPEMRAELYRESMGNNVAREAAKAVVKPKAPTITPAPKGNPLPKGMQPSPKPIPQPRPLPPLPPEKCSICVCAFVEERAVGAGYACIYSCVDSSGNYRGEVTIAPVPEGGCSKLSRIRPCP